MGSGEFTLEHQPSGANDLAKVTVYELNLIIDGLSENLEVSPGAFIGYKKRKSLQMVVNPSSLGGKVALSLKGGLKLYESATDAGEIVQRQWEVNAIPSLFVEGSAISQSCQDKECELTWEGVQNLSGDDYAKVTVVGVSLTPYTPNTKYIGPMEIPVDKYTANKVGIRLNGDYDNGGVARDWAISSIIPSEKDLIRTDIMITPSPSNGLKFIIRKGSDNVTFWRSAQKGGIPYSISSSGRSISANGTLWAEWSQNSHGVCPFVLEAIEERNGQVIIKSELTYRSFTSMVVAFVGENQVTVYFKKLLLTFLFKFLTIFL
jgi:hypothetical protein